MSRKQRIMLCRILTAGGLWAALQFVPLRGLPLLAASLGIYLIIGYDILLKSAKGIARGALMDENFLMSIASLGALALGMHDNSGDYNEAIAVMLFYQIGELFQRCAVDKSRRSIAALMDICPASARVRLPDGQAETRPPEDVRVGETIIVHPGEKIPLDGVVTAGESSLDTSALTGESLPRPISPGDTAASGSINLQGVLHIRTTHNYSDSTVSKILELVEEATERKSRSEQFITQFARIYTPLVCAGAALLALLPPLIRLSLLDAPAEWSSWGYRALVFLVISCPCALVISIPLSFFAGIGGASRAGILIKGANFLETLARTRTLAFDKTGTLTRGEFRVTSIHPVACSQEELLTLAALAESASGHPIAKSLQTACPHTPDPRRVADICEHAGRGITACIDGQRITLGSAAFLHSQGIPAPEAPHPGTAVHLGIGSAYAGCLCLADKAKAEAAEALQELRELGIRRTIMLTGDHARAAAPLARELGIDQVHADLLPADKVSCIEALLTTAPGKLAYVGDGINDAPALSRADIGIAMGALGSAAAIEAADLVLMHDNLRQLPKAIRLARRCLRIVYQNIGLALGIKFTCLGLGALGLANMWLAILADVGVMILAILNAARALRLPG
ncbi:MAG: cadmium-translocating P-type ATPase [Akkermansiaceae bacterium]|nr:cadmium-translocating P-type ATPase [Akkermansiaceae bacterium]